MGSCFGANLSRLGKSVGRGFSSEFFMFLLATVIFYSECREIYSAITALILFLKNYKVAFFWRVNGKRGVAIGFKLLICHTPINGAARVVFRGGRRIEVRNKFYRKKSKPIHCFAPIACP